MEPSWHQNRSKIDANCEKRFFEKSCSRCSGGSIFEILGVEVGSKNPLKNRVQDDFGRQVGRETGAKIDPKRHRKTMQKRTMRLPKKSQEESPTPRGGEGLGSWYSPNWGRGGHILICGVNPSTEKVVGEIRPRPPKSKKI